MNSSRTGMSRSLRLLHGTGFPCRLAEKPHGNESTPASDRHPDSGNPGPRSTDGPAARPLIVSEMARRDFAFLVDAGEEGSLVVDSKMEDAVLVRKSEARGIDGRGLRLGHGLEVQTVEGREHGELELHLISRNRHKRDQLPILILGELNRKCLESRSEGSPNSKVDAGCLPRRSSPGRSWG